MIIMADSSTRNPDRRVCERIDHNRVVVLKLDNSHELTGTTNDISLGGVCISTQETIEQKWLGQSVNLMVKGMDGELSPEFPCTIVRCDNGNTVCLQLDKDKAAQFGTMLTRGIFKRKVSTQ